MSTIKFNLADLTGQFLKELKERFGKTAQVEIRVDETGQPPIFSEDLFWGLMDLLDWSKKERTEILASAVSRLADLDSVFIYLFADLLSEKLSLLNTKIHAAAFAEKQDGKLSADDFLYARCAVIAEGKDYFEKILNNPSEMPTEIIFEPLLSLAANAYRKKTGKDFQYAPTKSIETHDFS